MRDDPTAMARPFRCGGRARALSASFDTLVERFISAGADANDIDLLAEAWKAEVNEQLPPLRARAVRLLQAAPDAAITWD